MFAFRNNASAQVITNFNSQMFLGSRGTSVCALQNFLISKGYLNIPTATCYYGPLTFRAVQALQRANGLPTPGRVGPATLRLLNTSQLTINVPLIQTSTTTNQTQSTTATSNPNTPNTPTIPCPTLASLKVEYPNGGERFQSGSSVDVKWSSNSSNTCPLLRTVSIFVEYSNPNLPSFVPTVYTLVLNTPNDGIETLTLPNISQASQVGPYYVLTITDGAVPYGNPLPQVQDSSDNVFSIY